MIVYKKSLEENVDEGQLCSHNPLDYKGLNPLEIPFHGGWSRFLYKSSKNSKSMIVYSTPCGRRLSSMLEIERFLDSTNCLLTTDLFSFDVEIVINREFRAEKVSIGRCFVLNEQTRIKTMYDKIYYLSSKYYNLIC